MQTNALRLRQTAATVTQRVASVVSEIIQRQRFNSPTGAL